MTKRAVVMLIALVVVSDAVVLALASWNRSGQPECTLVLTERELAVPSVAETESTGLALTFSSDELPWFTVERIARRRGVSRRPTRYAWLDDAKLAALGFRAEAARADLQAMESYARAARPVFVALEMDGPVFAQRLADREGELAEARAALAEGKTDSDQVAGLAVLLALERAMGSRLVPVDADRDAGVLRARYADRTRYCIAPGMIRLWVDRSTAGKPHLRASVSLQIGEIDVPRQFRRRLEPFLPRETVEQVVERESLEAALPWPQPRPPRYTVKVAFGRRLEPWIVDVEPLPLAGSRPGDR